MPRKTGTESIGKTAPGNVVTLLELLLDEIGGSGVPVIERPD